MGERVVPFDLQQMIAALGGVVVAAHLPRAPRAPTAVEILDIPGDLPAAPGAVLLGVGLRGDEVAGEVLPALVATQAAALVVRSSFAADDEVQALADDTRVAVVRVAATTFWGDVVERLRFWLADTVHRAIERIDSPTLCAMADSAAGMVDGAVAIHDRHARMLAFSGQLPPHTEPPPPPLRRLLDDPEMGRRLNESGEPTQIDVGDETQPLYAVTMREGSDVVGSLWISPRSPFSATTRVLMTELARSIAARLQRSVNDRETKQAQRSRLMAALLDNEGWASQAAARLGLDTHQRFHVLAAELVDQPTTAGPVSEGRCRRFGAQLASHLDAVHPGTVTAVIDSTAYAVLPANGPDADENALRAAQESMSRISVSYSGNVGLGRIAGSIDELSRSRREADRALRVLRSRGASREVVHHNEVQFDALLIEVRDLIQAEQHEAPEPYRLLAAYDAEHSSDLTTTLEHYLDSFGDIPVTAARLHTHPNTVRYRLQRIGEIAALDLADPDARLAIALQLRLHRGASQPPGVTT